MMLPQGKQLRPAGWRVQGVGYWLTMVLSFVLLSQGIKCIPAGGGRGVGANTVGDTCVHVVSLDSPHPPPHECHTLGSTSTPHTHTCMP